MGENFTNSKEKPLTERKERLRVENVYKIFGENPERAFELIRQGKSKDEVYEETGLTIGVQDASFSVYEGEVFVIMGLSGSGKSTLVRMLNRLIEPTSGKVFVEDSEITTMNTEELIKMRRDYMSMVFQSFALMPHMTVLQNAAFGMELSGFTEAERSKRAMEAIEQVGLKAVANSYPKELSGGMQQRVGLARGLAVDPDIMLMDEAFSALDPLIRTEMQDELLSLQENTSRSVVFISHDLDEAMRIGDRIAMMEGGRIVQIGTPEEILKNPADEYVKAFFRGVDPTHVLSASDIVRDTQVTLVKHSAGLRAARERLIEYDRDFIYVLDKQHKFLGVVSADSIEQALKENPDSDPDLESLYLDGITAVPDNSSLQEVLTYVTNYECPVPVIDSQGVYKGTISRRRFLSTLKRES
ncbi:MAG: glycine betaine/L-proline ABC transporter ATP-binding protein ProV [Thermodesulfobacteriota bacterium]